MGLRGFHLVFIALSIIISGIFAFWGYYMIGVKQSVGYGVVACTGLVTAIGLVVYMINFMQKIKIR